MDIPWPLIWLLLAIAPLIAWMVVKSRTPPGAFLDMSAPPWTEAMAKARATIPTLRQLFDSREAPIDVKFPLRNSKGETEHVWGELLALTDEEFTADLRSPLIRGRPESAPPFKLPLSTLEDWLTQLPDGTIRGGFTTQLEIALAREEGRKIPAHIESMETRFVDV